MAPPTDPLGTATSSTFRAAKTRVGTADWAGRVCPARSASRRRMAKPLKLDGAATLHGLLADSEPASNALDGQIPCARAVGRCGCGCVTVNLTVDRAASPD
jgi:hypothetical protein